MRDHKITIRNDRIAVDLVYHWPLPHWKEVAEEIDWQLTKVRYESPRNIVIRLDGEPMSSIKQILDRLFVAVYFQPEWREDRSWNR